LRGVNKEKEWLLGIQTTNAGKDTWNKEPSYTVGGTVN
jgi:hypothetical protein